MGVLVCAADNNRLAVCNGAQQECVCSVLVMPVLTVRPADPCADTRRTKGTPTASRRSCEQVPNLFKLRCRPCVAALPL